MATNYDPILNRLRTFRFYHGNDTASLRQERIQDALDIEEYGMAMKKLRSFKNQEIYGFLLAQTVHYFVGGTAIFKACHPYLRVSIRAAFLCLPVYLLKIETYNEMQSYYDSVLQKKVGGHYEDSLTLKYKELSMN